MEHTSTSIDIERQNYASLGLVGPDDSDRLAPAPVVEGLVTTEVRLPSGGWAQLKDAKEIRAKHRKKVFDQMNADRLQAGTPGVAFDMVDSLMIMMVEKWHVPYLPDCARPLDDITSVDELTIPDYDALSSALEGARQVLFPTPATVDGAGVPGSPTPPAGG